MQAVVGEDPAVERAGKAGDINRAAAVFLPDVELPVEFRQGLKNCIEVVSGQIVEVDAKLRRRLPDFPTGSLDGGDDLLNG